MMTVIVIVIIIMVTIQAPIMAASLLFDNRFFSRRPTNPKEKVWGQSREARLTIYCILLVRDPDAKTN